ncbi:MAG TPA: hypothetical protein VF020_13895 [Chthoniobacterales bacterium]
MPTPLRETPSSRRKLIDPSYEQLESLRRAGEYITTGGHDIPELWAGGQFAYAFSDPPYGLWATPGEVQAIFREILGLILPRDRQVDIRDWGSPGLLDVCPAYFQPGTEWWGVFLFSLHDTQAGNLTVIAGASTD